MERNTWSKRQDECLKTILRSMTSEISWVEVDRIMKQQYGIQQKSAKKCRQRWNNNLNPAFNNLNWSCQQQEQLLRLQEQFGNKWALIKTYFNKRTDIFIKNQYYAIFRRIMRSLNNYMHAKKKNVRAFNKVLINQILLVNQLRFQSMANQTNQIVKISQQIKTIFIQINGLYQKQKHKVEALFEEVIPLMLKFKQNYNAKRSKKKRKSIYGLEDQVEQFWQKKQYKPQKKQDRIKVTKKQQTIKQQTVIKIQKNEDQNPLSGNSETKQFLNNSFSFQTFPVFGAMAVENPYLYYHNNFPIKYQLPFMNTHQNFFQVQQFPI